MVGNRDIIWISLKNKRKRWNILLLYEKKRYNRAGRFGAQDPISQMDALDTPFFEHGHLSWRPSPLRSDENIDRQKVLIRITYMLASFCFRMEHVGSPILGKGNLFFRKNDGRHDISRTLFGRLTNYIPETLYFTCIYHELLTPLRPEKYEFPYSDFHSLLQYIFDLLILIGYGLIEPYGYFRISHAFMVSLEG